MLSMPAWMMAGYCGTAAIKPLRIQESNTNNQTASTRDGMAAAAGQGACVCRYGLELLGSTRRTTPSPGCVRSSSSAAVGGARLVGSTGCLKRSFRSRSSLTHLKNPISGHTQHKSITASPITQPPQQKGQRQQQQQHQHHSPGGAGAWVNQSIDRSIELGWVAFQSAAFGRLLVE